MYTVQRFLLILFKSIFEPNKQYFWLTDSKAPISSVAIGSSTLSLDSSLICGEYSSDVRSISTARSMQVTVEGGAPSVAVERREMT